MSDTEESAWGSTANSTTREDVQPDFPLQYSSIFVQCQPSDGKVSLSRLGAVISRTPISSEVSAEILARVADPESSMVTEDRFFWALAQAAAVHHDPNYQIPEIPIDADGLPLPPNLYEVELVDSVEEHPFERKLEYVPATDYTLEVSVLRKDAGSFLMKHALFSIDGVFFNKPVKCIHRFRDFCDLLTELQRRYPFRAIPVPPPKRLAVNGMYLVGNTQDEFLQRRAESLTRFLHLLVQHPVLAADHALAAFLMVRLDQEGEDPYISSDELCTRHASPLFISTWTNSQLHQWQIVRSDIAESHTQVIQLLGAFNRSLQRHEEEKADLAAIGRSSLALGRSLDKVYPFLQHDLKEIEQRLEAVSTFMDEQVALVSENNQEMEKQTVENLRLYRDMLFGVLDLFKRHKQLAKNTIPELEKRIAAAQRKLASLSASDTTREDELHRQRTLIQSSQADIRAQTNRDWLIKMVMTQELRMVQTMQYQLSRFLRSLGAVHASACAKQSEAANRFADVLGTAPLNK